MCSKNVILLNKTFITLSGEEISTFSFEDAMSFVDADAVLVEA